jgi:hypothetical protein
MGATAAETIGTSQRQQPATTVLESAAPPTAQYKRQQLISFRGNSPKSRQNGEKCVEKDVKSVKILLFLSDRFQPFR